MEKELIFLSYSRKDSALAVKLANDLRENNLQPWIDQLSIRASERWDNSIKNALLSATTCIVILSPYSTKSENVLDEVNLAIKKNKKIIPIIARQCEIPFRLERFQYIDFSKEYDKGLDLLLKELNVPASPPIIIKKRKKKLLLTSILIVIVISCVYLFWLQHKINDSTKKSLSVTTIASNTDSVASGGTSQIPKSEEKTTNKHVGNILPNSYLSLDSAIQNALPGDTIILEEGNYNSKLEIKKNINIIGKGDAEKIKISDFVKLSGQCNVVIKNLTFLAWISIEDSATLFISNCNFWKTASRAIGITMHSGFIDVRYCHFNGGGSQETAIALREGLKKASANIQHCNIERFAEGIYVSNNCAINIDSSNINENFVGIKLVPGSTAIIKNSDLRNNVNSPVDIGQSYIENGKQVFASLTELNNMK